MLLPSINSVGRKSTEDLNIQKRSAKAIAAGSAVALVPSAVVMADALLVKPDSWMQRISDSIKLDMPDIDTFENIKSVTQKALHDSGLGAKGVSLKIVNAQNLDEVERELVSTMGKQPFSKRISKSFAQMFKYGANAAFEPKYNRVYIGENGLYSSVFHELGHAMNYNNSKILKFMQKARIMTPYGVPVLGLGLLAASLFHKEKPESVQQPKSSWEKTKDFVKNNAGKLTFVTFIPMLAEEAIASIKGIKLAKNYLKPEQILGLKKNYLSAFKSYAQVAVVLSAAVGLGNMLAQYIQQNGNVK